MMSLEGRNMCREIQQNTWPSHVASIVRPGSQAGIRNKNIYFVNIRSTELILRQTEIWPEEVQPKKKKGKPKTQKATPGPWPLASNTPPVNKIRRALKWKVFLCWSLTIVQGQKLWLLGNIRCIQWSLFTHLSCSLPRVPFTSSPPWSQDTFSGEYDGSTSSGRGRGASGDLKVQIQQMSEPETGLESTPMCPFAAAGMRDVVAWPLLLQWQPKGADFHSRMSSRWSLRGSSLPS